VTIFHSTNSVTISSVFHIRHLFKLKQAFFLNEFATFFMRTKFSLFVRSTTDKVYLRRLSKLHIIMVVWKS
jgi:hypothetical protein